MDIGALNARITFQKNETFIDDIGNHTNEWVDYFSCSATISDGSGSEDEKNGVVTTGEKLNFTVRYCVKLSLVQSTKYRIIFRDNIYDIQYVDIMNFKKKALKFKTALKQR